MIRVVMNITSKEMIGVSQPLIVECSKKAMDWLQNEFGLTKWELSSMFLSNEVYFCFGDQFRVIPDVEK